MCAPQNDGIRAHGAQTVQARFYHPVTGCLVGAVFYQGDKFTTRQSHRLNLHCAQNALIDAALHRCVGGKQSNALVECFLLDLHASRKDNVEHRQLHALANFCRKDRRGVAGDDDARRPHTAQKRRNLQRTLQNLIGLFGSVGTKGVVGKVHKIVLRANFLQFLQNGKPSHTTIHNSGKRHLTLPLHFMQKTAPTMRTANCPNGKVLQTVAKNKKVLYNV